MSDRDLYDAAARKTGESNHEIAHRGFVLAVTGDASSVDLSRERKSHPPAGALPRFGGRIAVATRAAGATPLIPFGTLSPSDSATS